MTAVRPDWLDLPAELRSAISARLDSPVVAASTAGGGFTRGFAAVLRTASGESAFVKAASRNDQPHLVDWYGHEAVLTASLPAGVAAPRLRWTLTAAEYFAICLDAVPGRMPALPWTRADLDATLSAYATTAEALREPPAKLIALGLPQLADVARTDLSWWREIAEGRAVAPDLPLRLAERLPDLVALEGALPDHAVSPRLIHGDLRLDNVIIDGAGRAWICDWTWACFGPAWFDLAELLVTAYASGLDTDTLFATHPAAAAAPPDALDAALSALSGYWLTRAAAGPTNASPLLCQHQRWSGETALAWLAGRRGWC